MSELADDLAALAEDELNQASMLGWRELSAILPWGDAFDGFTGYGRRMSSIPASTNTSASPSFAQQTPIAPRSICHRATTGDLCVFACGRSRMPAADASC